VVKAGAGEARSLAEATETLLRIQAGLAIKKPTQKKTPKKTTKNVLFLVFLNF
jgi:hypothetical protein